MDAPWADAGPGFAKLTASAADDELNLDGCRLAVYDRRGREILPLETASPAAEETDRRVIRYPFGRCVLRREERSGALGLRWRLVNETGEDLHLKVALEWPVPADSGLKAYVGNETVEIDAIRDGRRWEVATMRMPLLAVYPGKGPEESRAGIAGALAADEFHSEWVPEIRGEADGGRIVAQTMRVVVDAGSDYDGTFVLLAFSDKYAERGAIAGYHELYPRIFRRREGIDPRTHGISAGYKVWQWDDAEFTRKTGGSWDWCIKPFRRGGDIADSERFWEYDPVRPMPEEDRLSREAWFARQREKFLRGQRANVAMFFYFISGGWAESQLAAAFPDAIFPNEKPGGILYRKRWGPPQDDAVAVFSWRTSYGSFLRESLRAVRDRLGGLISGFAFDSPNGHLKYRGEALRHLRRKSWDEHGAYVSNGVAVAHLLDFVNSLDRPGGGRMASIVNVNSMMSWLSAFHCDAAMIEKNPWRIREPFPLQQRYAMGEKSLNWWEGYDLAGVVDIERATDAQLRQAIRGLADYTALRSFYAGVLYPHFFSAGVEYLYRLRPLLEEVNRAGWRAVPACTAPDGRLLLSRYGEGARTYIAAGNNTAEPIRQTLHVYGAECGCEASPVFAATDGETTTNRPDGRQDTYIDCRLPARRPRVFQAVAQITGRARVTARQQRRYDRRIVELGFEPGGDAGRVFVPRRFERYRLAAAEVDGRELALDREGSDTAGLVELRTGAARRLRLTYRLACAAVSEEQILALEALDDELDSRARILVADDADSRFLGERLQDCFGNHVLLMRCRDGLDVDWSRYQNERSSYDVGIPVQVRADLPPRTVLLLGEGATEETLRAASAEPPREGPQIGGKPESGVLALQGRTRDDLQRAVYDYMDLLTRTQLSEDYGRAWIRDTQIDLVPMTESSGETAAAPPAAEESADETIIEPPAWLEPRLAGRENLLDEAAWRFGEGYPPERREPFTARRDVETFLSGPDSLEIVSRTSDHSGYWDQVVPVEGGRQYFFCVRVRPEKAKVLIWLSGKAGTLRFDERMYLIQTKPPALVPVFLPADLTGYRPRHEWRYLGRSIEIPQGMSRLRVGLGSYFGPGRMHFDEAMLVEGVPALQIRVAEPEKIRGLTVRMHSTGDVIYRCDGEAIEPGATIEIAGAPADRRYILEIQRTDGRTERVEYPSARQKASR